MSLRLVKIIRNLCFLLGLAGYFLPFTSNAPALFFVCAGLTLNIGVSIRRGPRRSILGLSTYPFAPQLDGPPVLFMGAVTVQTVLVVTLFLDFLFSLL